MNTLKKYWISILVLILPIIKISGQSQILIKNAIVIDGTGESVKYDCDILIENSKVVKIGTDLKVPKRAIVLDCSHAKTVVPGLVNMHGHLYAIGKTQLEAYPILYLAGGVTSIFSPGEFEPNKIHEFRNGPYIGPDIYSAGPYFDSEPSMVGFIEGSSDIISMLKKFNRWEDKIDGLKVYTSITKDQFRFISKLAADKELFITGHLWRFRSY